MNLLFIGDIVARPGREAVFRHLDDIKSRYAIDFCIANGENASGGLGMTRRAYEELSSAGVDYFTMGNHTFSKSDITSLLSSGENIARPANYQDVYPGQPYAIVHVGNAKLGIINLLGCVYMDGRLENPFTTAEKLIALIRPSTPCIFVDFHAEATSEKRALGLYLDGRVSCIAGTHTHVQTSDACILPGGTAYITDVGMTGPDDSVLGLRKDLALRRFIQGDKTHYEASKNPAHFCAVVISINDATGHAQFIETLCL